MSFTTFSFCTPVTKAIARCGFTSPTPIQQQAIPAILEGRDLLGLAQTGTGKTAAFILPVVERLLTTKGGSTTTQSRKPAVLILAPTRELAEQIHSFAASITEDSGLRSLAMYGGVPKGRQIRELERGIQILIACPGRLLDLMREKQVDLSGLHTLILDEADQMFDKGFLPDIRAILRQVPRQRQSLIFSATMPQEIRSLTGEVLHEPVTVQLSPTTSVQSINHTVYQMAKAEKTTFLVHKLREIPDQATLVFTRTKHKARSLARKLDKEGFAATSLQGNLSQNRRQEALDGFRSGRYRIMVATDIAARGIDIEDIGHVINFDAPDTVETYIHRTGRTGRAQRSGDAWTFATVDDEKIIRTIEKNLGSRLHKHAPQSSETPAPAATVSSGGRTAPKATKDTSSAPAPAKRRRTRGAAPQGAGRKPAPGQQPAPAGTPVTQQPTGKKRGRAATRTSSIFGLSSSPVNSDQAGKKIPRASQKAKGGKAPAHTNNTAGQKTAREKSRNTQRSSYNG